jgi:hypothetical protein
MALFRSRKPAGKPGEWYYCVEHDQVEEGPQCPGRRRLGPYPSREAASHALERVAERNREWDHGSSGHGDG